MRSFLTTGSSGYSSLCSYSVVGQSPNLEKILCQDASLPPVDHHPVLGVVEKHFATIEREPDSAVVFALDGLVRVVVCLRTQA